MDDYIKYSSTRGGDDSLSYEEVLLAGLARDGGLFMPEKWPSFTHDDLKNMKELTYLIHKKLNLKNRWVYLKGGHLDSKTVVDIIYDGIDLHEIKSERIDTKNTHGTGCTLSSALASIHANNQNFFEVAKKANDYVNKAIKNSDFLNVGSGHGPLNHFHKFN